MSDGHQHSGHHEQGSHAAESHHQELGFLRRYFFSTDHKVIGIQYGITALVFLFFGFMLMMFMRWQLAFPGQDMFVMPDDQNKILAAVLYPFLAFLKLVFNALPGVTEGAMSPDLYNSFGAMHGTIMIFLGVVPLAVGAFGNYLVPLQVGAGDMAFPKLNGMSYWVYFVGGIFMLASFFMPGGAPSSGWTSYPPLSVINTSGQTVWILGMVFLITSSLLGSINIIVTIVHLRAKGLTFFRMPFHVWAQFVTSFLLLLAFPPLEAAAVLQLMDRVAGTSFFMPSGLVISGTPLAVAGDGNVLLWQHLFWFLAHPEVYVLILPAFGIITEVITNNTRKPLYGYKTMIHGALFLGFMSFIVWAHHMFITGMGSTMSSFFQATTMIISIPSVILLTCLLITLWGASIRYNVPMLFALAFLPMFAIGGLTGLPLGLTTSDIHLHDTYYVIGHFHYVVAPGTLFALFAGIYFWFPKVTGRRMSECLGKIHFWGSLIAVNGIFMPMFIQGLAGVNRRLHTPNIYAHSEAVQSTNVFMSYSAWILGVVQLIFIFNFFWSIKKGKKVESDNPWGATTLEWATPTPPPHGNFPQPPVVYRGPYEYASPETSEDYLPQHIVKV